MHILIITVGTRGDVQPYVALGRGLRAAGHTVTLCTCSRFREFILDHGLAYGYMTDELLQLFDNPGVRAALENALGPVGLLKIITRLLKKSKPIHRQMLIDSWDAARTSDPDLVLFHPKGMAGIHIAEKLGIPAVMATLQPMLIPSAEVPNMGFPEWKLGGWYNRLTHKMVHLAFCTLFKTFDTFRRDILGIGRFPRASGALRLANGRPYPILHGFSPLVIPTPGDWPAQAHVTGYWFLDHAGPWEPPADLKAFLHQGPPPVYVGFGSMAGRRPQRLTRIVIAALQQARLRGVLATGWGGLDADRLPDTIFKIETAPHDKLFPHMAAVVHHGGAGTTGAGLRAGKPTVICPFLADQPYWGRRVLALGTGPPPLAQKKLTVAKLAQALRTAVDNRSMRRKAAALGEGLRREDGVANAVALIEAALQKKISD